MSLNPFFLPHLPALPIAATFSPPCHPPRGQDESLEYKTARDRVSLDYIFDDPKSTGFLSGARVQVYYQNAKVDELRTQDFVRRGAGTDRRRLRQLDNSFRDRVIGGDLQLQSKFNIGTVLNRLTYGLDVSSTRNERVRSGIETRFNAAGQMILTTNVIGADNFPVKDFPDSDTFRLGIYVQNEMEFIEPLPRLKPVGFRLHAEIAGRASLTSPKPMDGLPPILIFLAAFSSLSCSVWHSGQRHSLTFKSRSSRICPQWQHILELGNHGSR
jgi:hemoglobin/transferrin/lactoferrin receptor protein